MQGPEGLFEPVFVTDEIAPVVSSQNWVQKMVDVECALAAAEAQYGVIPAEAANEIATLKSNHGIDPTELGRKTREGGTPVIPLVRILTEKLPESARPWIHYGSTSQDILDTATMLVVREAIPVIYSDIVQVVSSLTSLTKRYRNTPMVARTLQQHALPTVFGLKAANWLGGAISASLPLEQFYHGGLALQFGGAGGTLAALGGNGEVIGRRVASILGLSFPILPWQAQRVRIFELGSALSLIVGALAKISGDIILGSQAEVGEFSESIGTGGGSSALPQKSNPIGPIVVNACFRRVQGLLPVLYGCLLAENERGAGEWQAEWQTLRDLISLTSTSAQRSATSLANLAVDETRMSHNLELSRGNVMSEKVLLRLSENLGRSIAHDLVREAAMRSTANQTTLLYELRKELAFREGFTEEEGLALFDPMTYLGSAQSFIDGALAQGQDVLPRWQEIADRKN
ncbi:MAG: adenylosuccinate lyase family protein [Actinomycetota bacterium]|nr:MAG: adenylosuccinate lyase family protein [Actinomycetota bacterium]